MSKRAKKRNRARACYTCGFVARHARDTNDPCTCVACMRMPAAWRSERRAAWEKRVADRAWNDAWDAKQGKQLDTTPIKPIEFDNCAWPGGYQIMYYVGGDEVCPSCIDKVLRDPWTHIGRADEIFYDIFYEGAPVDCTECGETVHSACGDPYADENAKEDSDD